MVALITAAMGSQWAPLLYPLALLSVAGALMMLAMVNTMLVVLALRREGQAAGWRAALPVLIAGLALAMLRAAGHQSAARLADRPSWDCPSDRHHPTNSPFTNHHSPFTVHRSPPPRCNLAHKPAYRLQTAHHHP
jgi:hypothetical protein